jgi:hypothetical protein
MAENEEQNEEQNEVIYLPNDIWEIIKNKLQENKDYISCLELSKICVQLNILFKIEPFIRYINIVAKTVQNNGSSLVEKTFDKFNDLPYGYCDIIITNPSTKLPTRIKKKFIIKCFCLFLIRKLIYNKYFIGIVNIFDNILYKDFICYTNEIYGYELKNDNIIPTWLINFYNNIFCLNCVRKNIINTTFYLYINKLYAKKIKYCKEMIWDSKVSIYEDNIFDKKITLKKAYEETKKFDDDYKNNKILFENRIYFIGLSTLYGAVKCLFNKNEFLKICYTCKQKIVKYNYENIYFIVNDNIPNYNYYCKKIIEERRKIIVENRNNIIKNVTGDTIIKNDEVVSILCDIAADTNRPANIITL